MNCFKLVQNSFWGNGSPMLNLGGKLKGYYSVMLTNYIIQSCLHMIQEKLQYEWNARNQITLWGPRGEIRDYAIKQWAGVVADYFKPRWEVFIREMQIALQEKRTFNKKSYSSNVFNAVEEPFTFSTKHYSDEPKGDFKKFIQFRLLHLKTWVIGDPILKAKTLHEKWRKIYQQEIESLSPKARKLWRSHFFSNNKTKSAKSKQRNHQFSGTTRSFFIDG